MTRSTMRRYLYLALFFIVLIAPFVVRQVVSRESDAEQITSGDGDVLDLVVVTPHNQDVRRAFARAFAVWHLERFKRPARLTYLNPGGTNDIVRYVNDLYTAQGYRGPGTMPDEKDIRVTIDLVWGGGDTTFERELKPFLEPVDLPAGVLEAAFPTPDLNGVPLYDLTSGGSPRWVGVVLSSFGLVYSPPLYQTLKLDAPRAWDDLTNPALAGLVALADPTRSGSAAVTYMMAIQRAMADAEEEFFAKHPDARALPRAERDADPAYHAALADGFKRGMRTLQLMAANARYFTDSGTQVPNDVGNGDAAAGVAIDFYGRVVEQEIGSDRIRYIAPRGATAVTADPVAILYGVKGDRALGANRFVEFLLSAGAQRLWNLKAEKSPYLQRALRRMPVRRDVYTDRRDWTDSDSNPFDESSGFNIRGEWMNLYSDLRPIWATAWIDSRMALKEAYQAILRVPNPSARAQLLFDLSNLPIEMADIEHQVARRKRIESGNDPDEKDARLWMAQQRIEWGRKFRQHYHDVASRAMR